MEPKLPKVNISAILIAVSLGVLVAVGVYQAQIRGWVPNGSLNPKSLNQETRTIIQEENAVISVVEKNSPSVVAIGVSQAVVNPFDPFSAPTKTDSTIGTGFMISANGIIVTNKHVLSSGGNYSVVTRDGQKYEIKRIYKDPILDLALVQIEGSNIAALEMGDSSKLKVGQTVIAIGNALGRLTNTVTTGVVSGLGRKVVAGDLFSGSEESLDNLIQTDAAINPGNSGGPLLNSAGQVIGVDVATTEFAQNIGFAIPINTVKPIIDEFVQKGSVSRPYLGIKYRFISPDVAALNRVPQGAYIQEILANGPASKATVKAGDIITRIDNQPIDAESKIAEIISKANIGTHLELTIWRDGKEIKLTTILTESTSQ